MYIYAFYMNKIHKYNVTLSRYLIKAFLPKKP